MKKKDSKSKQSIIIDYENKKLSIIYFLPLLLIAGFVPLIVYAKYVDLEGTTQALYWTGQRQYLDFFSYWKAQWVVVLTAVATVFYIILYKQKKLPFKNLKQYYIPLGIYAIFVIISTIFAIDTHTALWGFVDMYQGMFVLLSYVLITFLTINFVNSEKDVSLFVNAFLFLMIVEGLIGITQYFGFDFFQTKIGNNLILPSNLQVDDLSFSFGPKTIYGTLFNTNFVGSFATLMLPLSVAFLLGAKTKKQRIISAIATILMIFVWIGCNSRAGYLGVAAASIFALFLFRKVIWKNWKYMLLIFVVFIFLFIVMDEVSGGRIWSSVKSFNISEEVEKSKNSFEEFYKYEDIIIEKNNITIKTDIETLKFKIDENKLYALDEKNNILEMVIKGNEIIINGAKGYTELNHFLIENKFPGLTIKRTWGWPRSISFYFNKDDIKILGSGGRLISPEFPDKLSMFDGIERMMSNRGFIWSRTIPLLKDNIIRGKGPDNFIYTFPQDDVIGKLNVDFDANTVVDKPHNMFLQIGINTGVLSLIALIVVWSVYIVQSVIIYSKLKLNSIDKYVGAFCSISITGYLVAAMFNDQVISVSPIFWLILGLGISLNYKFSNKYIEE